jgi:hypothetical protein
VDYTEFLDSKLHVPRGNGITPTWMPDGIKDFQAYLVEWNLRNMRTLTLSDCGTGKSLIELTVAENIVRHTNGRVLLLTPLAVAPQMVAEGEKFGVEVHHTRDGNLKPGINVTNYERLHYFDPRDFVAVLPDESSILKSFEGTTRAAVTEFMRRIPWRHLFTATAAPNDYTELGTSSEALGHLGYVDMLGRFYTNKQRKGAAGNRTHGQGIEWRLKRHAEDAFWRWVCSWARAMRKPSDLGFEDGEFVLPPLTEQEHAVASGAPPEGKLFHTEAANMQEHREELRRTLHQRAEKVAELVDHDRAAVMWCNLNPEADLLERIVPGARQISGRQSDEEKEEILAAFARGEILKLVTKPQITGFGLNWQHCAHTTVFPTFSYEQYYQLVRRFWRFLQTSPVTVDLVVPENGKGMLRAVHRKARQADLMFSQLVRYMNDALHIERDREFTTPTKVPAWL